MITLHAKPRQRPHMDCWLMADVVRASRVFTSMLASARDFSPSPSFSPCFLLELYHQANFRPWPFHFHLLAHRRLHHKNIHTVIYLAEKDKVRGPLPVSQSCPSTHCATTHLV